MRTSRGPRSAVTLAVGHQSYACSLDKTLGKDRVGADTEHIFSEDFWEPLNAVTNALDNVEARTYVD